MSDFESDTGLSDNDVEVDADDFLYLDNENISYSDNESVIYDLDDGDGTLCVNNVKVNKTVKKSAAKTSSTDIIKTDTNKRQVSITRKGKTDEDKPSTKPDIKVKEKTPEKAPEEPSEKTNKKTTKKEEKTEELEKLLIPDTKTIDQFTAGIDAAKVLTKKSPIENDTVLLCLLLKTNKIKPENYKCSKSACKIRKTWNNKQLQLLISRKNGIITDLTPSNLELLCPNCYLQTWGMDLFIKTVNRTEFLCKYCKFPLINFSNSRKKGGICISCEKRLINIYDEHDSKQYEKEVKDLYKDNPILNDDIKKTKYYKEVGKYKNFTNTNTNKSQNPKQGNLASIPQAEKSIIINCNTDIGDIDDLNDLIEIEDA